MAAIDLATGREVIQAYDAFMTSPLDDFDCVTSWRVEMYRPLSTEFHSLAQWRSALRSNDEPSLRLTKLARTEISGPGAQLPLASFRVALDAVMPLSGSCAVCGEHMRAEQNTGVTTAGIAFHNKCLPGTLVPGIVEELLVFAEEVEQRRPLSSVVQLTLPPHGR